MTRRWIVLPVVGFGLVAGSVGSYAAWSNRAFGTEEGAGDGLMAEDARQMTQAYLRACVRGREAASQCFKSEVADATRSNDLPRLLAICGNDDTPFRDSEDAALLVSRGLLMEERATELERLREFWRGREKNAAAWLALDADVLLRGGRADEARSLLSRTSFPGAEDAGRLARLALAADDPSSALELLNRATALAPNEADVRACRGRYFEDLGRPAEAAAEFAAALAMRDNDWVLRDELAECYRREGDLGAATATWLHAGRDAVADFAWVKAWFWNRVARPVSCDWEATAPDVGRLQWLAAYLVALPPGQFWIRDAERTRGPREPLVHRQETYWLHLLALFQEGQEDVAGCVLRATPPRYVTWQPDLADGLDRVLSYRSGRPQRPAADNRRARRHPFLEQLESLAGEKNQSVGASALPGDVAQLLQSKEAIPATLLAAGWDEAALELHDWGTDLSRFPEWYAEGLLRACWNNRGTRAALASARRELRTPAVDLVTGEMLIAEKRDAEALDRLRSATESAATGQRAAWLFALLAVRQGRPAEARRMLETHPRLTDGTEGQLLLARCAAAEGNDDRAEQLYRELVGESAEARAYLARRAVAGGDWETAARLTGALLRDGGR